MKGGYRPRLKRRALLGKMSKPRIYLCDAFGPSVWVCSLNRSRKTDGGWYSQDAFQEKHGIGATPLDAYCNFAVEMVDA